MLQNMLCLLCIPNVSYRPIKSTLCTHIKNSQIFCFSSGLLRRTQNVSNSIQFELEITPHFFICKDLTICYLKISIKVSCYSFKFAQVGPVGEGF